MDYLAAVPIVVLVLAGVLVLILPRVSGIVRYISNTRVGVVEKLWSSAGSVSQGLKSSDAAARIVRHLHVEVHKWTEDAR